MNHGNNSSVSRRHSLGSREHVTETKSDLREQVLRVQHMVDHLQEEKRSLVYHLQIAQETKTQLQQQLYGDKSEEIIATLNRLARRTQQVQRITEGIKKETQWVRQTCRELMTGMARIVEVMTEEGGGL